MNFRAAILGSATTMILLGLATSALAAEGFAREPGQLRAGPDNDYPSLAPISRGVGLQVYDCIEGYTWCDVSLNGERGWYPGNRIELLRNGNRVVITEVGREVGVNVVSFSINTYWQEHYASRPFVHETHWYSRAGVQPPKGVTTNNTNINIKNNSTTTNVHETNTTEINKTETENVNKTKKTVDDTKTKEVKAKETKTAKEPARTTAEPQKKPANAETEPQPATRTRPAAEAPARTEPKSDPAAKPACPVGKTC